MGQPQRRQRRASWTGQSFFRAAASCVGDGKTMTGVAFISAVLSKLALLGAAACFIFSGVGLTNGPLCFYNASEHGHRHGTVWGYPFLDTDSQEPDARTENYLYDPRTWSTCLEPEGIVAWNVVLFSLLLLISAAEMVLASFQILNGCLGCLCGFCDGKKSPP
ncbi:transmembrane 4 L6 family member 1-like protein [Amazona aestiva]|uniref:Transmembrane 4 L6 family member 1-like protein n=1 Tax=Amazona aestiva TaxID=12930 RepID=A0A0Q3MAP6_AMAAE|nr:transmembrane 4 L6 family member 1-like protein [Amazona aestiva]